MTVWRRLAVMAMTGGTILGGVLAIPPVAPAGEISVAGFAGGTFGVGITSLKERKWATVIRQEYDYSCGSAAVATLLTYHYDAPTDEATVFERMYRDGDQPKIQRFGFSMLDMKRYLDGLGYKADGFRVPFEALAEFGVPVITLITIRGYKHFVVVKGVENGKVVVGDPALGLKRMPQDEFIDSWDGVILAVRNKAQIGRASFNQERDRRNLPPAAPVGEALLGDSLSSFTLMLPGRGEFY
ncbi:MAG: C39 family peptidase [Inquilinaceae bacterium]